MSTAKPMSPPAVSRNVHIGAPSAAAHHQRLAQRRSYNSDEDMGQHQNNPAFLVGSPLTPSLLPQLKTLSIDELLDQLHATRVVTPGNMVVHRSSKPRASSFSSGSSSSPGSESGSPRRPSFTTLLEEEIMSPRVIFEDDYLFEKTLGEGSYGKVKLAVHKLTQEKVAIKIIDKASLTDSSDRERIIREIIVLKNLRHPNIARLYEVIDKGNEIHLVIQYCSGGELFDYIVAHQRVKEREAVRFLRQIVSALEYCHKRNVIHRDLKTENLLLDGNRNIKIIDFGFTNTYNFNSLLETYCGSPAYAAPEMISAQKYTGPEADVWSLGVTLFAIVCGYLPFDDDDTMKMYHLIREGLYYIPEFVSPEARDLIVGLLRVRPQDRLTIPQIKKHPWVLGIKLNQANVAHLVPDPFAMDNLDDHDTEGELDDMVVEAMGQLDFSPEEIKVAVQSRHLNRVSATYHLLRDSQGYKEIQQARRARARKLSNNMAHNVHQGHSVLASGSNSAPGMAYPHHMASASATAATATTAATTATTTTTTTTATAATVPVVAGTVSPASAAAAGTATYVPTPISPPSSSATTKELLGGDKDGAAPLPVVSAAVAVHSADILTPAPTPPAVSASSSSSSSSSTRSPATALASSSKTPTSPTATAKEPPAAAAGTTKSTSPNGTPTGTLFKERAVSPTSSPIMPRRSSRNRANTTGHSGLSAALEAANDPTPVPAHILNGGSSHHGSGSNSASASPPEGSIANLATDLEGSGISTGSGASSSSSSGSGGAVAPNAVLNNPALMNSILSNTIGGRPARRRSSTLSPILLRIKERFIRLPGGAPASSTMGPLAGSGSSLNSSLPVTPLSGSPAGSAPTSMTSLVTAAGPLISGPMAAMLLQKQNSIDTPASASASSARPGSGYPSSTTGSLASSPKSERKRLFSFDHAGAAIKSVLRGGRPPKASTGLRTMRGAFNASTTTSKEPVLIMEEIIRVLEENKLEYEKQGKWGVLIRVKPGSAMYSMREGEISFEMEICKIKHIDLNGIHLVRLHGDIWAYKRFLDKFLPQIKL